MKIKKGVNIQLLAIEMRVVLKAADKVWKEHTSLDGVTVTSGLEGKHGAGSYHPFGYAVDLGTKDKDGVQFDATLKELLRIKLQAQLLRELHAIKEDEDDVDYEFEKYDIVVEDNHIHAEYEVDKW